MSKMFSQMSIGVTRNCVVATAILASLLSGCNDKINTGCDDCRPISHFESEVNYESAIKLINDSYDPNQTISLNGQLMDFDTVLVFKEPNFYELIVDPAGENLTKPDTFLFTIQDPQRGITEWGLRAWTPLEFQEDLITTEEVEMIYPPRYLEDTFFPVIVDVKEGGLIKAVYVKSLLNSESFNIKRGRGSLNIDLTETGEVVLETSGHIHTLTVSKNTEAPVTLPELLNENTIIPKNAIVHIQSDMTVADGVSLVFSEGSIAIIDRGVTIRNEGSIEFNGTPDNRILITSSTKGEYWGGFVSSGGDASITATETFFSYSGYNTTPEHTYGHAQRQALFKLESTSIDVQDCYFIDHIGQLFYPTSSEVALKNIYVQRVKSTGEMSGSNLILSDSYLTDFPDDTENFRDEDNDALYISNSNATITNCTFMYAKDDGVDSGSDRNGGMIIIEDSHFEACFHEGAALSSYEGNKRHTIRRSTFQNCGQGIELGFSSSQHNVLIEDCLIRNNLIGIRYGDNYPSSDLNGQMQITNSLSIDNLEKDIWNMGHKRWAPTLEHLSFENTFISLPSEQYPEVEIVKN